MSTADIVILCVLGVVTAAVIAYLIYRKKKKGSCCGCCENCHKTQGCLPFFGKRKVGPKKSNTTTNKG